MVRPRPPLLWRSTPWRMGTSLSCILVPLFASIPRFYRSSSPIDLNGASQRAQPQRSGSAQPSPSSSVPSASRVRSTSSSVVDGATQATSVAEINSVANGYVVVLHTGTLVHLHTLPLQEPIFSIVSVYS